MTKRIMFATIFICSLLLITGCGNKSKALSSGKDSVHLQMTIYKQENQEGLQNIVSAFEQANPGITVEIIMNNDGDDSTNSKRADEGDLPDILQMQSYSRVTEYASRGLLMDLSDQSIISKVLTSSLTAVSWNGKIYAVPTDYAGIGVIYNKDIFSKCGLSVPQTFKELEKCCTVLKSKGYIPFAPLLKDSWSMGHILTLIHTALLKEKNVSPDKFITDMNAGKGSYGDVDTKKLFEVLDFYSKNIGKNGADMDGADQQRAVANGQAAMMIQGLWAYIDAMSMNPSLNAGFFPFPVFNDSKMNVFYADVDSVFGISSQSSPAKQAAAIKFLDWLLSSEGQKQWMTQYKLIPPVRGVNVQNFGGPYVDLMKSVEEKGSMPWAFSQYPSAVFDGFCKEGTQQYILGNVTQSQLIKTIDQQWTAALSK